MTAVADDCPSAPPAPRFGTRKAVLIVAALSLAALLAVIAFAVFSGDAGIATHFRVRLAAPSFAHPFGTDALGRDMLARTLKGLALSFRVGLFAATASTIIALMLALVAAGGPRWADAVVAYLVDMTMGLPHLVLLILISFALGGGTNAVIVAVALTHWPRLTRILRAEILQLRGAEFVTISRNFGKSPVYIARHHFAPHLIPQMLVGLVLMFPHAILHEAGLTFLGFGIEPTTPAIGVLLSESLRYLTAGKWWLGMFPGLALLLAVLAFDAIGNGLRAISDPRGSQS